MFSSFNILDHQLAELFEQPTIQTRNSTFGEGEELESILQCYPSLLLLLLKKLRSLVISTHLHWMVFQTRLELITKAEIARRCQCLFTTDKKTFEYTAGYKQMHSFILRAP